MCVQDFPGFLAVTSDDSIGPAESTSSAAPPGKPSSVLPDARRAAFASQSHSALGASSLHLDTDKPLVCHVRVVCAFLQRVQEDVKVFSVTQRKGTKQAGVAQTATGSIVRHNVHTHRHACTRSLEHRNSIGWRSANTL